MSLLNSFDEGSGEEYNKAGQWEKEYRQNDRLDRSRPTLVRSIRNHPLQDVQCGWNHTVALTVLGEVLVWGDASHGKLGIGKTSWETEGYECYCPLPWPLAFPSPNVSIKQLSCGNAHTAFISKQGHLYVCGSNDGGRLGIGRERLGTTVMVPELVEYMTDHKLAKVACGATHTLVLTAISSVWEGDTEYAKERKLVGGVIFQAGSAWAMSGVLTPKFTLVGGKQKTKKSKRQLKQEKSRSMGDIVPSQTSSDAWMSVKSPDDILRAKERESQGYLSHTPCRDIAAGYAHSCAVTHLGELYTWGSNVGGGAGHPLIRRDIPQPSMVQCLYQRPKNLALGKPTSQSSRYNIGPNKWHKAKIAVNGVCDGNGESKCTHTFRNEQAWWEVDLGANAKLESLKLWNRTDEPYDKGQPRDYFSNRLFPFWIIISTRPLPKGDPTSSDPELNKGTLDRALKIAESARRFDQSVRCTEWACPSGTVGRYIRVQLEETNFLHFAELECFGNWGRPGRPVAAVEAGRNTTVAIVAPTSSQRDMEEAYLRAVKADTHNAIILRQYESFTQLYDIHGDGSAIEGPCILCTSQKQCEICYMNHEFHEILKQEISQLHPSEVEHMKALREKSYLLMTEKMPSVPFIPDPYKPIRHCTSTCADFSAWKKRKREGGRNPTIWEALERAGNYVDSAYDLYEWELQHRVMDVETELMEQEAALMLS
tara:strand:- start:20 stop:2146 length:2127 start_codon:yes stop_codon:yes gene_type:complete